MADFGPKPLGRAACPECGEHVLVNRSGRMRHHGRRQGRGSCPGSYQPAPGGSVRVLSLKDGVVIKVRHAPGTLADEAVTDELVLLSAERDELLRIVGARQPDPITEHATEFSGGSMLVWNEADYVTAIWPTADKIRGEQDTGGKVWVRKVIVVEDWTEVPRA